MFPKIISLHFLLVLRLLTLSDFCTDLRRPVVTFVRIYPYTDFAIKIWGFNRHLTDILLYHQHKVFTCFLLQATIASAYFVAVFREFLKVTIAGPSSNSSIGMENNNKLYGISAVKVKLVDSLI